MQADIGDLGSIPELGRFTEVGNGNPLQYSCLGNPMDKETWQSTVCGVAKSWTCLSNYTTTIYNIWASPMAQQVKSLPAVQADIGDLGSIPELGRSPEGGNGDPLQYSCLGNSMDKETWQATAKGLQRVGHY